jgi:hypothetical protein
MWNSCYGLGYIVWCGVMVWGLLCGVESSLGWWCFFCMKMYCLEHTLFHYSKLHRIASFKVVVGICTRVIRTVHISLSKRSICDIKILIKITDPISKQTHPQQRLLLKRPWHRKPYFLHFNSTGVHQSSKKSSSTHNKHSRRHIMTWGKFHTQGPQIRYVRKVAVHLGYSRPT